MVALEGNNCLCAYSPHFLARTYFVCTQSTVSSKITHSRQGPATHGQIHSVAHPLFHLYPLCKNSVVWSGRTLIYSLTGAELRGCTPWPRWQCWVACPSCTCSCSPWSAPQCSGCTPRCAAPCNEQKTVTLWNEKFRRLLLKFQKRQKYS